MCRHHNKVQWIISLMLSIFFQPSLVSSLLQANTNRSELIDYLNDETKISNSLLVGYDKRFIPTLEGTPLRVHLQIVVADVLKIENMEAEMIIFIRQTWYDHRLTWNSTKRLKIREHFLDKIWLPDIRIVNLKDVRRFDGFGGVNMNIYPDGKIYFSQQVHIKTSCPMDLHRFPMDRQVCFLNFSSFAYGKKMLNFSSRGRSVQVRQHKLPQFELVEAKEIVDESSGGVMSTYSVALTFQRQAGYYILQVYIPASFLVVLSWLSFFMEASNIADRLALDITMILSTVFLLGGINESVVHVSYAKASDWFVIVSFSFIFMALLETMLVYRLSLMEGLKRKNPVIVTNALEKQLSVLFLKTEADENQAHEDKLKQQTTGSEEFTYHEAERDVTTRGNEQQATRACSVAQWIDKVCLVLFPTFYIAFNIGYWTYYTH